MTNTAYQAGIDPAVDVVVLTKAELFTEQAYMFFYGMFVSTAVIGLCVFALAVL